jgi:hypothetical protein
MLYVNFSGCSFASIGLLAAALSPFVLVVRCPAADQVSGSGGALPLWIGVRGFIIALFIMSLAEYFSSKAGLCFLSYDALDKALKGILSALDAATSNKDPSEALEPVSRELTTATTFGKAAIMEPRGWKCKWKYDLVMDVAAQADKMLLDVKFLRSAMLGADGKTKGVMGVLGGLGAHYEDMHKDLLDTFQDAQEVTNELLKHEWGLFKGMSKLDSLEGTDELSGFDLCIAEANKLDGVAWPKDEITTIEDDLLVQINIILMMLNSINLRVAGVIAACVRMS